MQSIQANTFLLLLFFVCDRDFRTKLTRSGRRSKSGIFIANNKKFKRNCHRFPSEGVEGEVDDEGDKGEAEENDEVLVEAEEQL